MWVIKLGVLLLWTHLTLGFARHLGDPPSTLSISSTDTTTVAGERATHLDYNASESLAMGRTVKNFNQDAGQVAQKGDWQLLWNDEFDGSTLNMDWWSYDVGPGAAYGNNELQTYTAGPNLAVTGGKLSITAKREPSTGEWPVYTSARINTRGAASWCPGMVVDGHVMGSIRIDVRAKVPAGQGLWSAFWMLPDGYPGNEGAYGTWPSSGEIDIMEVLNRVDTVYGNIHYGGWSTDTSQYMHKYAGVSQPTAPLSSDYHVYSIEWSADHITWYLDNEPYGSAVSASISPEWGWFTTNRGLPVSSSVPDDELAQRPNAPFDQRFYLIINLSVGGGWPGPPDATTPFPSHLLVDWIRVAGRRA